MSSSWPAAPEAERPTGEGDLSFGGLRSPPPRRRKTVAYQQATPSAGARQTQGAPPATPRREAANGKAHAQGHGEAHGGRAGAAQRGGAQGGLVAGGVPARAHRGHRPEAEAAARLPGDDPRAARHREQPQPDRAQGPRPRHRGRRPLRRRGAKARSRAPRDRGGGQRAGKEAMRWPSRRFGRSKGAWRACSGTPGTRTRPKARPTSGSSRAWAPPSSTPPTPARPSGSCT